MLPGAFSSCVASGRTEAKSGSHHQISFANAHNVFAVTSGLALLEKETPENYKEAMASKDAPKWIKAMEAEFNGCVAAKTWKVIPRTSLPSGTNILRVKWIYKMKTDESGVIVKYKARITPKGFMQKHGQDYFEVFANTGKYKTLRVALSIAASQNLELQQLDVPQAFTQAELEEDVYMEMPEGFEQPGMVCHLKKSLYGLKQSPRNWYRLVSTFLVDTLAFQATVSDPCLFWKKSRTGQLILLFLFVDDMQVAFDKSDEGEWSEDHEKLWRRFNITDLGESKFMLGMRIRRDRSARTITLDQELYVTKALEKFGLDQSKPTRTPGPCSSHDDQVLDQAVASHEKLVDLKLFQEKVGTLLYAAISTRPDIGFAVNKLTQRMQSPTVDDMKTCDRVFRYLAGTKTHGLLFGRSRRNTSATSSNSSIVVSAWADSDWAGDPEDRKSISGWIAMVNGDPVSWASKKQKVVSQSSTEAELYAEAAAINESKWLQGLLKEIGVLKSRSSAVPVIYGDNQSAQALSKNGIKSERTKHISTKYAFIHDEVSSERVKLQWIPTTEQLADILTKSLPRVQHELLRGKIMVKTE